MGFFLKNYFLEFDPAFLPSALLFSLSSETRQGRNTRLMGRGGGSKLDISKFDLSYVLYLIYKKKIIQVVR